MKITSTVFRLILCHIQEYVPVQLLAMAIKFTETPVAPVNVKTTLNVKTAKCEKPNNR